MYENEHYFDKIVHFATTYKIKMFDKTLIINILFVLAYHLAIRNTSKQVFLALKRKISKT